jgi:hypothetical protein
VRRPDFFIVGAPKCATTAMFEYLRQHPQIFMPQVKELHYFGSDLVRRQLPRMSEEAYLRYFDAVADELRVGEASVRYLQSACSAQEIAEFAPDARIIIMLRDPIEMMHAMHSELVFSGMEEIADFGEALAAEPERARGQRVPATTNIVDALLYRKSARFAEQVSRYMDVFGRDRVKVLIYDDLRTDMPGVYRSTLEFLGVDPGFTPTFEVVNPAKRPRSRFVRNLVASPPPWVRLLTRGMISRRLRKRIGKGLQRMNAVPAARAPIDPALRAQLVSEYAAEVTRLGELLGRDLSGWGRTS